MAGIDRRRVGQEQAAAGRVGRGQAGICDGMVMGGIL